MPRLLIVTGRSLPTRGGSQYFYDVLSRHLAARGFDVTIAATRMPPDTAPPSQPHAVVYGPTPAQAWRLVRQAQIVHFNDFNYFWWCLAKLLGKRTVIVYHTAARICPKAVGWNGKEACGFSTHWRACPACLHQDRSWLAAWGKWASLPIKQWLADCSDVIVNISGYTERRFRIPRSRMILHGIDLTAFYPAAAPTRDYFLYAARLVPEKGCDIAIRALAKCVERGRALPLVIAGEGPERPALEALVRELGLTELVRFDGVLTGEPLLQRMQHAKALLMPVLWVETFGRGPLEAGCCGTPTIASSMGYLTETVGEAGLLCPPGNVEAMAKEMLRLCDDAALYARLQQAGLAMVQRYNLERELEEYRLLYLKLVGEAA